MRFSANSLRRFGEQSVVESRNGTTVVNVSGGVGSKPATTDFDFGTKVSGTLNANQYNSLYSYFQGLTKSENYADTMAAVILDISLITGLSPREVAEKYASGSMNPEIYASLNALRPKASQEELVGNVNNGVSYMSRNINP